MEFRFWEFALGFPWGSCATRLKPDVGGLYRLKEDLD